MKKSMFALGLSSMLVVPMFMACESVAQKEQNVKDAQSELDQVTEDESAKQQKEADAAEWNTYRNATEAKITANADRIAELRIKKAKPGKALDPLYAAKIDALQTRNADLKTRLDNYENEQSDWESFKREFDNDMNELGTAFEDLGNDNVK
jgi:chromosome segregation ATPase